MGGDKNQAEDVRKEKGENEQGCTRGNRMEPGRRRARMSARRNEVWDQCRDEGDPAGRWTQTSGQALTHLEVVHFCSEAKNPCSTPHGPFTLIVLLGVKPCVQKLEGNENERRGLFDCIPEDRKVI